jgi:hypothetical protein
MLGNKRHGHGVLIWKSRREYVGIFQDDKMHGEGSIREPGCETIRGLWQKGI